MALQMIVTSASGIEIQNAYIKVDEYSCSRENMISARIRAYVSRDFEKEGKSFIEGTEQIVTLEGDYSDTAVNTKKQIYEYMKTLDEFENAVDVLE